MNNKHTYLLFVYKRLYIPGIILLLCFTACKKEIAEVLPDDKKDIAVNFYSVSDVMRSRGEETNIPVYIDSVLFGEFTGFINSTNRNEFPVFPVQRNNPIAFTRFNAGRHRIQVGLPAAGGTFDTTANLVSEGFYCLYFADAPSDNNGLAAYTVVAVPERVQTPPQGTIGVRFIHLSPDAGPLICSRRNADGSLANALSGDLLFGAYSSYSYFNTTEAVDGLLRFSVDNPAAAISFPVGVSAISGRMYTVVVSGFHQNNTRIVPWATGFRTVEVSANLNASVRRTY